MRSARHAPGAPRSAPSLDALVHPVPLAALAVLLVNDHILKVTNPGWVSGKLSDFAGLVLLPFVLLAAWDFARLARPALPAAGPRLALACVTVVVVAFTAIEAVPLGSDLYRVVLGGAQWPFRILAALVASRPLPGLAPVQATSDLSDLLALPAALIVLAVRPWRGREPPEAETRPRLERGGASRGASGRRAGSHDRESPPPWK